MSNNKQLPEGWRMVKFGDMATHISKRVEPSETNLNIYVGLEHLDPDSLRIKRHGVPSDVEGQKLLVKKGQIIFGKRRAYQRKLGVADWDCICSAHAMVLEANSETILPDFLPFFMQSDVFMNRAVVISEGSLSPTIKWKSLSQQKFPLPDKTIQKTIVELCRKISDVENNLLALKLASLFTRRKISEQCLIYDSDGTPWKKVKAFDVCELITKGASPRWQGFEYVDDGTLFVTSENVLNEIVDISEPKFIPNEFSEVNLKRSRLKKGDVLVNIVGASIGRCAIWNGKYKNANGGYK
jgi:type I restriction enzyme S subunit